MRHSSSTAQLAVIHWLAVAAAGAPCWASQEDNILLNPGAEQGQGNTPATWYAAHIAAKGLQMERTTSHAHSGNASLLISNVNQYEKPVANNWAQVLGQVPTGKLIRLSAWVKTQDAETVNVCVQCWGEKRDRLLAFTSTPIVRGNQDWTLIYGEPITVPAETATIIVRAALTGMGQAWFDDLSLVATDTPIVSSGYAELTRSVSGQILRALPITRNCMILAYMPQWRHGGVAGLSVANNKGGVRSLVAWDGSLISNDEANRPDRQFLLAMYCHEARCRPPVDTIGAYELLQDWPERTSWSDRPSAATQPISTYPFIEGKGWKLFDVTFLIRSQVKAKRECYGVMLRFAHEDRTGEDWSGYSFFSRDIQGPQEDRRPLFLVVDSSKVPSAVTTERKVLLDYLGTLASLPDPVIRKEPGAAEAYREALSSQMPGSDAYIASLEQYIRRYPLTPNAIRSMNSLGLAYSGKGDFAAARRIFRAAMALARNDSFANVVEVNLAHVDIAAGNYEAAENALLRIMSRPVPTSMDDSDAVIPHVFSARRYLAALYEETGRLEDADRILKEMGDVALELTRKHPDVDWLPSYVFGAYRGRVNVIVRRTPENSAAARDIAEEFKERMPGYDDGHGGCYEDLLASIEHAEKTLRLQKEVTVHGLAGNSDGVGWPLK